MPGTYLGEMVRIPFIAWDFVLGHKTFLDVAAAIFSLLFVLHLFEDLQKRQCIQGWWLSSVPVGRLLERKRRDTSL
jgi:hypothetical protein